MGGGEQYESIRMQMIIYPRLRSHISTGLLVLLVPSPALLLEHDTLDQVLRQLRDSHPLLLLCLRHIGCLIVQII